MKLNPEAMARAKIKVAEASKGPMANKVLLTGELFFNEEKMARVKLRLAGRVVKITADYGVQVQQGAVLAVIDSVELGRPKTVFYKA